MEEKVRLSDIASELGLSTAAVSYVLHGKAGMVSERTAIYREKLPQIRSFTTAFAVSDYYAVDLIHFLQNSGVDIPGEISVAGFDNTPLCELAEPVVTLPTSLVIRDSIKNC